MMLYITTHQRHDKQITLHSLKESVTARWPTALVVQPGEYADHKSAYATISKVYGVDIVVLPTIVTNLAQTRQHLLRHLKGRVCLLDDDFTFAVRREDDPTKFRQAYARDMVDMVEELELSLGIGFPLAGIASRQGGNRLTTEFNDAARQGGVHAVDTDVARHIGLDVSRLTVMNDFDMILQFLTKGHCNRVLNEYVWNQGGSNTPGGVSGYRTMEVQAACAIALKMLYPDFVSVVQKQTKGSWGGQLRTDVVIQWKRAYAYGSQAQSAVLDSGTGTHPAGKGKRAAGPVVK